MNEKCFCGRPIHYTDLKIQEVMNKMVRDLGPNIVVESAETGRKFLVPRHYIALHGLKHEDLDKLGFSEIKTPR